MQNAHLRMGTLQFTKITRDTTIDVRVHVDRAIAEREADTKSARCHLLSVFGNDQEVAAIAAALSEEARFYLTGPQIERLMIQVGPDAAVYRSSITVPGRHRPGGGLCREAEDRVSRLGYARDLKTDIG